MLIPFIFKITLSSKLPMYYCTIILYQCTNVLMYSFCAGLLQPLTIWSVFSSTFLHSLLIESPWSLSIFSLTRFVLILWFWAATIRLFVSLFKCSFWNQVQHWLLLISLVWPNYWPCRTFSSKSSDLLSFFDLFKIVAASKPSFLYPLQPVSIFSHFHEHKLPNPILLTQHNA